MIAPVLWTVVYLIPDVIINIEQKLNGKWVKAHGKFEFILTHGAKRICIIQAKKEDFEQGLAQNLLGCEVAADLDDAHEVYGIITNFEKWYIVKSLDQKILIDEANYLCIDDTAVPMDQLQKITGKLYSLLPV